MYERPDGCHEKNGLRQDFCIDAHTNAFEKRWSEAQMMEAVIGVTKSFISSYLFA